MIAKCDCIHCQNPIEFESEHSGETIDCPHCAKRTRLAIPVQRAANPVVSAQQVVASGPHIEDRLDGLVLGYFVLSCIVAGILGVVAIQQISELNQSSAGSLFVAAIAAVAQAWIFKMIINGGAEAIRLLRKIASK